MRTQQVAGSYFRVIAQEVVPYLQVLSLCKYAQAFHLPSFNQFTRQTITEHHVAQTQVIALFNIAACCTDPWTERARDVGDIAGLLPLCQQTPGQVGVPVS